MKCCNIGDEREMNSKSKSLQYVRYNMKVPAEEENDDYYGSESDEEEKSKSEVEMQKEKFANQLYAKATLIEDVDVVTGIQNAEYAEFEKDREREENEAVEIAIIGFWRMKEEGVFRCIQSFTVPNPMKRQVADTGGTVLYQVLFGGKKDKDIFFFYEHKNHLRLGVLDLESDQIKKKMRASVTEALTIGWNCA